MRLVNYGICEKCRRRVPATHLIKEGKVYFSKECPDCGTTKALISSDADTWQRKRDICHYDPETAPSCDLNCVACGRQGAHHPRMVFLDVTNRCNMNCPICIANIPHMGFEFHPPLVYFEHVLDGLSRMSPKPTVQLFGGEPTVRDDLFEIIRMAKERKLRVGIVTNGLKLADEAYCKKICETRARVLFGFDGRDPEIYERLRKNPTAYEKKVKGLDNLKKFSDRRHTIMCCVARKINDKHMRDLIDYCHANRDFIAYLHLIPLTETWKEGEFETDVSTTIEDVEQIIDEAFPDEKVEFVPSGLTHHLTQALAFFGGVRLTFGGVHPNCESATILISDGTRYRPLSHFLKRPLDEIGEEILSRTERIAGKLARLNPDKRFQRLRGRWLVLRQFLGVVRRSVRLGRMAKGNWILALLRILAGRLLLRKTWKHQLRKHTNLGRTIGMLVLPFEEVHSVEGARLYNCTAGFAYEDPDDGVTKTIPVCAWALFKDDIQRKIAEKYRSMAAAD